MTSEYSAEWLLKIIEGQLEHSEVGDVIVVNPNMWSFFTGTGHTRLQDKAAKAHATLVIGTVRNAE